MQRHMQEKERERKKEKKEGEEEFGLTWILCQCVCANTQKAFDGGRETKAEA